MKDYIIVHLHIDDMLILGSNRNIMKSTKNMLSTKFDAEDLGVSDMILETKISEIS